MLQQPTKEERELIVKAIFGQHQTIDAHSTRFDAYFKYYCSVVCPGSEGNAVIEVDTLALQSHTDVLSCIRTIVQNPNVSFNEFADQTVKPKSPNAVPREKEYIASLTTQVLIGIDGPLQHYSWDNSDPTKYLGSRWEGNTSFLSFVESVFSAGAPHGQHFDQTPRVIEAISHKKSLKAWKLNKRYEIEIIGTNNLLEHLLLDPKTRTLKVFHQVFFLRAHLEKSRDEPLDLSFEDSLRMGTLPPRLLLETLVTFHEILFPITSIMDTKWIDFVRTDAADMGFNFWGERLARLYDVVERPPPTNAIVAWFERHTSERNALTVAIIGVLLSVLFGLLSFIVGLLQLILAWVVYKYPQINHTESTTR
ncbi:hypothetical protein F53441_7810 [Fusarium austroafricanum]|uniref:Uncharacterized protein n=1 Tax=Fusarium austroafricanum TaxID=2364996 RepID=A0A8H4NX62_9HYPO|nr:hypothetical protein F53441_7810 [Fusarium austroafricanum]